MTRMPEGFHSVTPFFMAEDADALVAFMKKGLNAEEVSVLRQEKNGKIWHAQMRIGDSLVLVGHSMGQPVSPMVMYLYCDDADEAYHQALKAGAESVMEPADQFYGDRNGGVKDPFGNTWWFATQVEEVSEDELKKRAREFEKKAA